MRSIDYFSHNQTKKIWEPTLNMSLFKQFWGIKVIQVKYAMQKIFDVGYKWSGLKTVDSQYSNPCAKC